MRKWLGGGGDLAVVPYATALLFGRGIDADPEAARVFLEEQLATGAPSARGMLAGMLADGEGGPTDGRRALALLTEVTPDKLDGLGRATLARLYLDNRYSGRRPRAAAQLLTQYAGTDDLDSLLGALPLLVDYDERLASPAEVLSRATWAATVGEPGAAMALARLKLSSHPQFRDVEGARRVLAAMSAEGDREATIMLAGLQFGSLASGRMNPPRISHDIDDAAIRSAIVGGMARGQASASRLKGELTRVGALYPQDDVAASALLLEAAELGDIDAMVLAGEAYSKGLGVEENPSARLRWWRRAAREGSIEAQSRLGSAFSFDFADRLMTLREGISGRLVLTNNGIGRDAMMLGGMFSGSQAQLAGPADLAHAVMDAWRIAPAGLDDEKLLNLMRAMPTEVKVEIEKALVAGGHYDGAPAGHFGPDVRTALAAWVDAMGPLPDDYLYGDGAPVASPAVTSSVLPDDLILRAHERVAEAIRTASSPEEAEAAVIALNTLARYGDLNARWLVMQTYHTGSIVSDYVTPEEITRYGIDIVVTRPEGMDKVDFEFIFDITKMYQRGEIGAFGPALIDAVRDDPRLHHALTLGSVLQQAAFAPGACDSVRLAAMEAGMEDVGDGCDVATRAAIVAYAKEQGPAGIEAAERESAATELLRWDQEG